MPVLVHRDMYTTTRTDKPSSCNNTRPPSPRSNRAPLTAPPTTHCSTRARRPRHYSPILVRSSRAVAVHINCFALLLQRRFVLVSPLSTTALGGLPRCFPAGLSGYTLPRTLSPYPPPSSPSSRTAGLATTGASPSPPTSLSRLADTSSHAHLRARPRRPPAPILSMVRHEYLFSLMYYLFRLFFSHRLAPYHH